MTKRFHLGLDYGTSASKLVFRDFQAPGGEKAYVIFRKKGYRIPAAVGVTTSDLIFGCIPDAKRTEVQWLESIKMRVAGAAKREYEKYCFVPCPKLPEGFSEQDLAILSVWFLLSVGHQAITAQQSGRRFWPLMFGGSDAPAFKLSMTMGIPTSFYDDRQLRESFLHIARVAFQLYQQGTMEGEVISRIQARRNLDSAIAAVYSEPAIVEKDLRDWIRMEAEAALLWPFQSPAVPEGPYAKIDIGAGTTNASIFRIVADPGTGYKTRERIAFFGACSKPSGMDAIDRSILVAAKLDNRDLSSIRGQEEILIERAGIASALRPTLEAIDSAYSEAWRRALPKLSAPAEQSAWTNHSIFFIGGGSLVSTVTDYLQGRTLQGGGAHVRVDLQRPDDLYVKDLRVSPVDMAFLAVAHGLSNPLIAIPVVDAPHEVAQMDYQRPATRKTKRWQDDRDGWRWD